MSRIEPSLYQLKFDVRFGTPLQTTANTANPSSRANSWFGDLKPLAHIYPSNAWEIRDFGLPFRWQSAAGSVASAIFGIWRTNDGGANIEKVAAFDVTAECNALAAGGFRELVVDLTSDFTEAQRTITVEAGYEYYWGLLSYSANGNANDLFSVMVPAGAVGGGSGGNYQPIRFSNNSGAALPTTNNLDAIETSGKSTTRLDWSPGYITLRTPEMKWIEESDSIPQDGRTIPVPWLHAVIDDQDAVSAAYPAYSVMPLGIEQPAGNFSDYTLSAVSGTGLLNNIIQRVNFSDNEIAVGNDTVDLAIPQNRFSIPNSSSSFDTPNEGNEFNTVYNFWYDGTDYHSEAGYCLQAGTEGGLSASQRLFNAANPGSESNVPQDPIYVASKSRTDNTHNQSLTATQFPCQLTLSNNPGADIERLVVGRPLWILGDSQSFTYGSFRVQLHRLMNGFAAMLPYEPEILMLGRSGSRWFYGYDNPSGQNTNATTAVFEIIKSQLSPALGSAGSLMRGSQCFWMGLGVNDVSRQSDAGDWPGFLKNMNDQVQLFLDEYLALSNKNPYRNQMAFLGLPVWPNGTDAQDAILEDLSKQMVQSWALLARAPFYDPHDLTASDPDNYIGAGDGVHYLDGGTYTEHIQRNFISKINEDAVLYTDTLTPRPFRKELYAKMAAAGTVTNLVPANRITQSFSAQGDAEPRIVFTKITGDGVQHMGGDSNLRNQTYQIDCVAADANQAEQIADAVRDLFHAFRGQMGVYLVQHTNVSESPDDIPMPDAGDQMQIAVSRIELKFYYSE